MDLDTARVVIPVVASAVVAILVAGIGFTSAVVVMSRTLHNQRELDALKDARGLRDAKRDRLRQSFEVVLMAAITIQNIVHERRFSIGNETEEQRDARLQRALSAVVADVDRTRVRLLLETDATPIVNKLDETYNAFRTVVMLQQLRRRDQTEAISWQQIQEAEQKVEAGARELEETMRRELAKHEKLLDQLPA